MNRHHYLSCWPRWPNIASQMHNFKIFWYKWREGFEPLIPKLGGSFSTEPQLWPPIPLLMGCRLQGSNPQAYLLRVQQQIRQQNEWHCKGICRKLTSEPNIQISNDQGVTEKARKKDIVVDLHTKRESDQDRQRRREKERKINRDRKRPIKRMKEIKR